MKDGCMQVFMIDTDPDMVEAIWDAISEFDDFELPSLRVEVWKEEETGEWLWEILKKGEDNIYYDKEPENVSIVHMYPGLLECPNPKVQAFLYVYKGIDTIVKREEGIS